jgi:hypothetical protein
MHGHGHIDAPVKQRELLGVGLDQRQAAGPAQVRQGAQYPVDRSRPMGEGIGLRHELAEIEPIAASHIGHDLRRHSERPAGYAYAGTSGSRMDRLTQRAVA